VTNREEQHPDTVRAGFGQSDSDVTAGSLEKSMWHLEQNAGAVASARVCRNSTPMRKILEEFERFPDYISRASTVDMCDETNSARVVFVGRII
jgi:hypothetical protein